MNDWKMVYSYSESAKEVGLPLNGFYYQTYGGGGEGGYLVFRKKVYSVQRNWFEPWVIKEEDGTLETKTEDDTQYVKFVKKTSL